jgi:hypothetical protein
MAGKALDEIRRLEHGGVVCSFQYSPLAALPNAGMEAVRQG